MKSDFSFTRHKTVKKFKIEFKIETPYSLKTKCRRVKRIDISKKPFLGHLKNLFIKSSKKTNMTHAERTTDKFERADNLPRAHFYLLFAIK